MMQLLPQKRPPSSILGLSLDGSRLTAVLLRRSNGSLLVQKTLTSSLALNPLNGDPELVGREIRNNLEQAGLRERRCVLGVPLSWALTLQVPVPELPEADLAGFLEIEAERGFPYAPEALTLATSLCRPEAGERLATLVALPRNHLLQMEAVMKAAQLRPVSFSLGLPAMADATRDVATGMIALTVGETAVELQVNCHGGVAALRSLEEAVHWEGAHKILIASVVVREIRVTLGQLSDSYRKAVRKVRLYGNGEAATELARDLAAAVGRLGLEFEHLTTYAGDEFRSRPPAGTTVSPAFSLAARHLTGVGSSFEFLPPKVSPLRRLTARISSRKLGWIGAPAAAVVLIAGVAILAQQWQLRRLQSQWAVMAPEVRELEDMQQQIRRFRPWFDTSFRHLSILRRLTEAFPVDGSVTARTLEIREQASVSCSGVAHDNPAFLRMLDQLRGAREVGNVQVDQVRGKTPLQFTVNFTWGTGGAGEN